MTIKTTVDGLKSRWANLTPRGKLLVGGGGVALLLLIAAANGQGGRGPGPMGPGGYAGGYQGAPQGGGYQGGGYQGGYQGGGGSYAGTPVAANNGGGDSDPTGYWARQRSQDQQAQAFGGYINDTTTVRDNDGNIHADVSNTYADPAIANGQATAVPTAELPTSTPAPSTDP